MQSQLNYIRLTFILCQIFSHILDLGSVDIGKMNVVLCLYYAHCLGY